MKASTTPLRTLLGFLRPFTGEVAFSILLGVCTVASGVALLGTSAFLIAMAALQPSIAVLEVSIVGVRFFGISRAVFRYLERLISHSVNFRLLAGLRTHFYRQLEPLVPARLQGSRSADLLSRAIADIETLENFYVRAAAPPLVALLVTVGVSWFVGRFDVHLGLLLAGSLLVGGLGLPILTHQLARLPGRAVVERRAELNAALLDMIQGMPDLLAFSQTAASLERIAAANRSLSAAQAQLARVGAFGNALGLLLTGLTLWGMLLLAIPLVGPAGSAPFDGVSLSVLALVTLASFEAVTPLTQAAQHLESSLQAARRLFSLVDSSPVALATDQRPAAGLSPQTGRLDLRIRGLCFAYPAAPPALIDFDLDLPYGKQVALVGPSGAGKTTLFNLLLRFWEPHSGLIEIDGQDIHCFDPQEIYRQVAIISQSTYLFAGTLRQNLLLARPAASAEDLERVMVQAQLAELVTQLPDGLDTWVGERGLQLSGGERQRVAVARALLRDASLLLLDEPTANLDAVAEQRLLAMFHQVSAGRSLLYITHRLVALDAMDEILVLDSGRVVERGSQAALLAAKGLYARLYQIQRESLE